MNEFTVKKYYKFTAIAGLVFGLLFVLLFNSIDLSERVEAAITANIGFHLFYHFIGKVLIFQLNTLKSKKQLIASNLFPGMLKLAASAVIAMSLLFSFFLFKNVFEGDYQQIIQLLIPAGLFLGALSLKVKLEKR